MGLTGSKKSKESLPNMEGIHEFEVYIPNYGDNPKYQSKITMNSWTGLQFIQNQTSLVVLKNRERFEAINIDSHFELINEQPDDIIFTIKFCDDNKSSSVWKVRCKTLEEYLSWTNFLKKSLRKVWKDSKKCQSCLKSFRLFLRKHHCRKCGECVCDNCSPIRSTLPELAYKGMVRICLKCGSSIEENRKGKSQSNTPNFNDRRKANLQSKLY